MSCVQPQIAGVLDASPSSRYPQAVTRDTEAAYVKQWAETGRLLGEQRWRELATLDAARALEAADALIQAALTVPLSASRRSWSGLVNQQDIFQRRRR